MANNPAPIIKKVKKVSGGGHHGGAWKVAYADFVTAMMAFFLLMWLLNASEAENLAGLADYFAPTVGLKDDMGIGFRGGKSAVSDGVGADKNTNKGVVFGGVPAGPITKVTEKLEEVTDESSAENIKVIIDKSQADKAKKDSEFTGTPQESTRPKDELDMMQEKFEEIIKNNRFEDGSVTIKRTPEGLVIEIKDLDDQSMFEEFSSDLTDKMRSILAELSKIIRNIPNNVAIIGHTSSVSIQGKGRNYTKWELSADRANATRSYIEKNGVQKEQISRIEGRADNVLHDKRRPEAPVNNRIALIILKQQDTPSHKKSTPDSLFMNLQGDETRDFIKKSIIDESGDKASSDDKEPASHGGGHGGTQHDKDESGGGH